MVSTFYALKHGIPQTILCFYGVWKINTLQEQVMYKMHSKVSSVLLQKAYYRKRGVL